MLVRMPAMRLRLQWHLVSVWTRFSQQLLLYYYGRQWSCSHPINVDPQRKLLYDSLAFMWNDISIYCSIGRLLLLFCSCNCLNCRGNNDVTERRTMTSRSMDTPPSTAGSSRSSVSSCGHSNAGQELCYVCHQRERRNVYVSFAEERRQKEEEENQLLRDFQQYRDAVAMHNEQVECVVERNVTLCKVLGFFILSDDNKTPPYLFGAKLIYQNFVLLFIYFIYLFIYL